jgi:hypothetical protein
VITREETMKKTCFLVLLTLFCVAQTARQVKAQSTEPESRITLYSTIKHKGEQLRRCVHFQEPQKRVRWRVADLCYGSLYVGDFHDWFDMEDADRRSVVKDLGLRSWSDQFRVPLLQPLPELKPGEHREVSVDASGKDGADGLPGADGASGMSGGADFRSEKEPGDIPGPALAIPEASRPQRQRHDGKIKVSPFFTKAELGHLYVIHVVDKDEDFYALFRVEELEPGDRCTISWRVIPNPAGQTTMSR